MDRATDLLTIGELAGRAGCATSAVRYYESLGLVTATRTSERGETRIDDKVSEAAMEDRKKNGYF